MTFFGFNVDSETGNLIELKTKKILEERIMKATLFKDLVDNKVNLEENFDEISRFVSSKNHRPN